MPSSVAPSLARFLATPRDAVTIARIVKVNHAGEYGAIRIYSAQIRIASRLYPDLVAALSEMLAHEKEHCAAFLGAMPARRSRPCRIMSLWSRGGWLLGALTALMGRQAIWACTAAVEAAVHRHLDDQLLFLGDRDPELYGIILSIQEQELSHLRHAEAHLTARGTGLSLLRQLIASVTDVLIWLSTWGDSARMASDLRLARRKAT
jgi:ubiquinone biosynthesis monooxygenase Coq7